ncbi:MAG: response regulator, partial [Bacteroidetes bacterium]|nr:response regulator [Bacteroidota bacterium]
MNKTVLIIDHTKRFTTSVAEHLHNRGYNVLSAQNRATAFRLYRKVRPNIVLIHEEFPNIDLVRIINIIHAKDDHIPIMLIVTDFEAANAISAFYRNVSDCITIDINPSDLALRIQRCLTTLAPGKPKIPLGQSLYLPEDFYILCDTGTYIDLIPKENELLFLFCSKLGETCTSEELIKVLWGQK